MINSEKRNSAPRIMVVDDEVDITLQLSVVLEENGFKVDPFNDALLALENFKPDLYDLLILDIKMPKMNGFELDIEVLKLDINVGICFDICKIINDQVLREFLSNYKCKMFYQKAS
jgi:FixJ family two-component response regulator